MIEFKTIYKNFEGGNDVLKDINLTCEDGEITVLIGPSGCGKTTTMKLINRLITPTKGSIFIDGKDISQINTVELRREIGYVIQHIGLFPHMTIARNVGVVPNLLKWDKTQIDARVDELLELVGLDPKVYKERYPSELSGGQQQRIGVIRALAAEPGIILMDEPFSALDPISREQLQEELIHLQKDIQKSIVFVTHDMDEALKIADKIVLMRDGRIIQHGSPEEILRRPANDFVKNFIGKKRLKKAMDMPTVADVMVQKPATILLYRGLAVAMNMMEKKQVDSLVVVDDDNRIEGYVSIYDVSREFDNETKQVKDIVQSFTHTTGSDALLADAVRILDESKLSYIPVVNADNTLAGLLTRGSIVGHMRDIYAQERWAYNA
ncbi:ABC transporter ATP-binding protein [Lentibacillus sp. CBA3610]|uniref:ABC transporter ATP-binding protein n=1 Tax=Lentibacillus sp. CBA3610 TaxID=2518176 RepID=UPI001595B288|nr:ABC transporter ATP-binding protein [Lentibacillus sp. CBA3610]QKY69968.1 ATP-binding cassette domain-containing protein [Lentibacillus sp. CBA3610]